MKKSLLLVTIIISTLQVIAQTNGGGGAVNGTVYVDPNNLNVGTLNPGPSLLFGGPTGEGIASRRGSGVNQYGLDFYTNHLNRMVITNGGSIGIGTTTPQKQLSIATGMNIDQLNQNQGSILMNTLTFGSGSGEGIGSSRVGPINQYGLDFYTNNLPRVFITNTGNVGIGIAVPSVKLQVAGAIMSSAGVVPSDIRYKKNILPLHDALKTVIALSAFKYFLKTEEFPEMNFDSRTQYGLLAQDVEKILPEIVYTGSNGYKSLDYTRIIPFLIEGMKEQQQTIEKQQQAIEQQQQQINELKKLVVGQIKNK